MYVFLHKKERTILLVVIIKSHLKTWITLVWEGRACSRHFVIR